MTYFRKFLSRISFFGMLEIRTKTAKLTPQIILNIANKYDTDKYIDLDSFKIYTESPKIKDKDNIYDNLK